MPYDCEITSKPAQPVLSIRKRTRVEDLPTEIGQAYAAVGAYMGELGQAPCGAPFVAYYNMDMQDLDVEMGFPVGELLPGRDTIQSHSIFGEKVATCSFKGPYQEMTQAYEQLTQYVAEKGQETTGVVYEVDLNSPAEVAPQDLETQIFFSLKD
jgi:effector-binding domain-containing protein